MKEKKQSLATVIAASSVGTLIEWYDFYIFGSLATILSTKFFPADNPTAAFLSTLATFAAGFVVRPFGAIFFGRLGDLVGRKYTFLITLLIMGFSTFAIGLVPEYKTIGFWAPLLVLSLRLLQGLALGGEYGGAATYVAEHSEPHKRGLRTAWIQTTATVGLFVSILVIMATRKSMSKEVFEENGWRIPFLVSIVMVGISYLIRRNMAESPLFAKLKSEGKISTNPLKESFGNKFNFKFVLLALFGATMGQGVVWYTGQFYALSFIQKICNIDFDQTNTIIAWALGLGTPFFIFFGWLSDKIGRKSIMLAGMLIALLSYRFIYEKMYETADISQKQEIINQEKIDSSIEIKKGTKDFVKTVTVTKIFMDGTQLKESTATVNLADTTKSSPKPEIKKAVVLTTNDYWIMVFLIFIQVIFVTMVYAPIAAFLVELFPTQIRYTSMSLPYHIGNGVFGGLLPTIATYLAVKAKDANETAIKAGEAAKYAKPYLEGLWYPIVIAAICFVIGLIYIQEKKVRD